MMAMNYGYFEGETKIAITEWYLSHELKELQKLKVVQFISKIVNR